MKDAKGDDRFVAGGLSPTAADRVAKNLRDIVPGCEAWTEEE